jgi:hypothetical protein
VCGDLLVRSGIAVSFSCVRTKGGAPYSDSHIVLRHQYLVKRTEDGVTDYPWKQVLERADVDLDSWDRVSPQIERSLFAELSLQPNRYIPIYSERERQGEARPQEESCRAWFTSSGSQCRSA